MLDIVVENSSYCLSDNDPCSLLTIDHSASVPYSEVPPEAFEAGTCEGLPTYGGGIHIESGGVQTT